MIKERNIVLQVVLTILTLGLYGIVWQVTITNDAVEASKGKHYSTGGILALVLSMVTCGLYGIYWTYKLGQSVGSLKGGNDGILYLILTLFGLSPVIFILAQLELNNHAK